MTEQHTNTEGRKVHRTRFEFPETPSPLEAKIKRAEQKEKHLKKSPSIYAMVIAGRLLVVCMLITACLVLAGGLVLIWYELAPYRATRAAEAETIITIEEAKAKAHAKIESNKILQAE
ncbi:hypothetical protein I6Y99_004368 [Vibrio parahaemolyticus]|nr:hypothetical protein [Vibrio parahaemolyticus]